MTKMPLTFKHVRSICLTPLLGSKKLNPTLWAFITEIRYGTSFRQMFRGATK